jgi:hypothetical protein
MARLAGASLVVFGHTHIPMDSTHDGVRLVNPGALASGSYVTRQRLPSVALLFLRNDGPPSVIHVALTAPEQVFQPRIDLDAGFRTALDQFSESILAPDLAAVWDEWQQVARLAPEPARAALLRAARPCWSGERAAITRTDLLAELRSDSSIPPEIRARFEALQG